MYYSILPVSVYFFITLKSCITIYYYFIEQGSVQSAVKVTCSMDPPARTPVMPTVPLKMVIVVASVIGPGTVGRTVLMAHMVTGVRTRVLLMQHARTARVIGRTGTVVPVMR